MTRMACTTSELAVATRASTGLCLGPSSGSSCIERVRFSSVFEQFLTVEWWRLMHNAEAMVDSGGEGVMVVAPLGEEAVPMVAPPRTDPPPTDARGNEFRKLG